MLSKIFAVIAAIREVVALGNRIGDMYDNWKDKQIDKHYEAKTSRRARLMKQIELETDDAKLRILHNKLRNLSSSNK